MRAPDLSLCVSCGVATTPCTGKRGCRHKGRWEYYAVHDPIWAAAGMKAGLDDQFLCIQCLERRLGRRLQPDDFTDFPINDPDDPWNTPLLASRMRDDKEPS